MGIDPVASRWIFFLMLALIAGATLSYNMLKKPPSPPPPEIAGDPLLIVGREVYQARCLSCRRPRARETGPITCEG